MSRANPRLNIAVANEYTQHPAVQALRDAGHEVFVWAINDCDLILHPAAHGWSEPMFVEETRKNGTVHRPYLEAALAFARARRKRKVKA